MKKPLELESTLIMTPDDASVSFKISCSKGQKLDAQSIIDCVSDMLMVYYGMSPDEWDTGNKKDLNS